MYFPKQLPAIRVLDAEDPTNRRPPKSNFQKINVVFKMILNPMGVGDADAPPNKLISPSGSFNIIYERACFGS